MVTPSFADSIEVSKGMDLATAKKLLGQKGIEVNSRYQLSVIPSDQNNELEFCNLDDNITLILAVDKGSKRIISLGLYFIPDNRTSKTQVVIREATVVRVMDDDQIELTFRTKKSEPDTSGQRR